MHTPLRKSPMTTFLAFSHKIAILSKIQRFCASISLLFIFFFHLKTAFSAYTDANLQDTE
jgi:uncharacterized membrane protein